MRHSALTTPPQAEEGTGTQISVFGLTPLDNPPAFSVSIDNSASTSHDFPPSPPHPFHEWYTSLELTSGWHSIELSALPAGVSFDYAVSVGSSTDLTRSPVSDAPPDALVVDDSDLGAIEYNGSWSSAEGSSQQDPELVFFGGGHHYSCSSGASFSVSFEGTGLLITHSLNTSLLTSMVVGESISLFGMLESEGSLAFTSQIDSQPAMPWSYNASTDGRSLSNSPVPNFRWLSYNRLSVARHTLTVNITECQNRPLSFDYALLELDELQAFPGFPNYHPSSSASPRVKLPTATIVGISLGVLACLAAFFGVYCRKRGLTIGWFTKFLRRHRSRNPGSGEFFGFSPPP